MPSTLTQKSGGVCAITYDTDVPALTVANFDPSAYDTVVFMVVTTTDCGCDSLSSSAASAVAMLRPALDER